MSTRRGSVVVTQGYHADTHDKSLAHAVDFRAKIGTRVVASVDGVVVDVVGHFRVGGTKPEWRHKANYVVVRTSEAEGGVYVRYYHLARVCVRVGEVVRRGQTIGTSGNTGFTFGPHLHLDVVDVLPCDVFALLVDGVPVKCVPATFSLAPENLSRLNPHGWDHIVVPLRLAVPLDADVSRTPGLPGVSKGDAVACSRGGAPSFREKARAAARAGAVVCLIADDDADMHDALPLLVGGSATSAPSEAGLHPLAAAADSHSSVGGGAGAGADPAHAEEELPRETSIVTLFVSHASRGVVLAAAARDPRCPATVEIRAAAHYRPRTASERRGEPFCKPLTLPFRLESYW